MTSRITVQDYMTVPAKKDVADHLMERFNIDRLTCDEIQISDDHHLVSFHVRTGDSWHWVKKFVSDVD